MGSQWTASASSRSFVAYPPTSVAYPRTAWASSRTFVAYPPTSVGYPRSFVAYPRTASASSRGIFGPPRALARPYGVPGGSCWWGGPVLGRPRGRSLRAGSTPKMAVLEALASLTSRPQGPGPCGPRLSHARHTKTRFADASAQSFVSPRRQARAAGHAPSAPEDGLVRMPLRGSVANTTLLALYAGASIKHRCVAPHQARFVRRCWAGADDRPSPDSGSSCCAHWPGTGRT